MKLKLTDDQTSLAATDLDGSLVPVVVYDDGSEKPLNVSKLVGDVKKTADRASEFEKERDAIKARHDALTAHFNGTDPEEFLGKARAAMETVQGLEAGDLADAEQLRKIKADVAQGYEDRIKKMEAAHKGVTSQLEGSLKEANARRVRLLKDSAFASSKFVSRLDPPPDMVQSLFGERFFEDAEGNLRANDKTGKVITSRTDPTVDAEFEEAIAILVEDYPHKSQIMTGRGGSGPGTPAHSNGSSGSGTKTIPRSEFEHLGARRQGELMAEGFSVT
jgi:hypothetical protein